MSKFAKTRRQANIRTGATAGDRSLREGERHINRNLLKFWRSARLWGPRRALFKALGRLRNARLPFPLGPGRPRQDADIGLIGCGQFGFSTIGHAIASTRGNRFVSCYDTSDDAARSFARFFGLAPPAGSAEALLLNERVRFVYVASNHASHADYAIRALQKGLCVYVEKPVAVSWDQLRRLSHAAREAKGRIFAGYNRPFSRAIGTLVPYLAEAGQPMTLSCFVSGHAIAHEHWYRRPEEGTRICGNVGHWLDLAVHLLSRTGLPDRWRINLTWSDPDNRDDNVAITMASERGDLISIVLSSRSEPFDGIDETIHLQCGEVIAKIDDFRKMDLWRGARFRSYRWWPKDVGHLRAISQPFSGEHREWCEIELSACLVLFISDMVRTATPHAGFSFTEQMKRLG